MYIHEKSNNIKFSTDEFNSLRGETIERISIMNNQASNAMGIILTIWASGFSLLGIQLYNYDNLSNNSLAILSIGQILSFCFSILMLIPMAIKSGENLRQLVSIGVYIKVFFNYISQHQYKDNKSLQILYAWESADKLMNIIIARKKRYHLRDFLFNSEYTILGFLSLLFLLIPLILNYKIFNVFFNSKVLIILYILLITINVFLIVLIFIFSNSKNNINKASEEYTRKYLILLVEMKLLPKSKLHKAWQQLNPHKEIDEKKYKKYFT